jgi:hypothetical protein
MVKCVHASRFSHLFPFPFFPFFHALALAIDRARVTWCACERARSHLFFFDLPNQSENGSHGIIRPIYLRYRSAPSTLQLTDSSSSESCLTVLQ